jgi:nucleoid DNA-binding protein
MRPWAVTAGVVLLGAAGLVSAQIQPNPPKAVKQPYLGRYVPLAQRVAAKAKLPEKTVREVLDILGSEVLAEVQRGGTETLPKLGTLRIVRIDEHKDLERRTGRVVTVAARNHLEFEAEVEVDSAANGHYVRPAEIVPSGESNPLPGQTPSQRVGRTRTPSVRTP